MKPTANIPWPSTGSLRGCLECLGVQGGGLRITKSSAEMDALCGRDMTVQPLKEAQVLEGLPDLVEVVTRVLENDAAADSVDRPTHVQNRVMITCLDTSGNEFDCEVRAVPVEDRIGKSVLCGIRMMGEKRVFLRPQQFLEQGEQDVDRQQAVADIPALASRQRESFVETLWRLLFAPPSSEKPKMEPLNLLPIGQAVWKALRCVNNLLMSLAESMV